MPTLSRAKARAQLTKGASNERQMGIALTLYVHENGNYYPGNGNGTPFLRPWFIKLRTYTRCLWRTGVYDCPGFEVDYPTPPPPQQTYVDPDVPFPGEYAYNQLGTSYNRPGAGTTLPPGGWLGLGETTDFYGTNKGWILESRVLAPSDMIAIGDTYMENDQGFTMYPLTFMLGYVVPSGPPDNPLAQRG